MKSIRFILIFLTFATSVLAMGAIDVLEVDGVRYEDVRFGSVNKDKVALLHSQGVTSVPIASLPPQYQEQFRNKSAPAPVVANTNDDLFPVPHEVTTGSQPPPSPIAIPSSPSVTTTTPATANQAAILQAMRAKNTSAIQSTDWSSYIHDRDIHLLLDGKLVDRSTLTPMVGFLARERVSITASNKTFFGAALDLAERKAAGENVPAAMEMRPNLWRHTDEQVFLIDYRPATLPGALLRVYAIEVNGIDGWRVFKVATQASFEDWKRLVR